MVIGTRKTYAAYPHPSAAVFLCLLHRHPSVYGRVERGQYNTHRGITSGATYVALVDARSPLSVIAILTEKHMEATMPKSYSGTPEHYLYIKRQRELDIDALNCAISRALAVQYFLFDYFTNPDSSQFNHEIMSNAVWALAGLLEQAEILINGKENNHE